MKIRVTAVLAACLLLTMVTAAQAGSLTFSQTKKGSTNAYAHLEPSLELATFDFSSELALMPEKLTIAGITYVSIKFNMWDGDTAVGDDDEGELVLLLGGYDTDIELAGYGNDARVIRTNSGEPKNGEFILADLLDDGKITAEISDLAWSFPFDLNNVGLFGDDVTIEISMVTHTPLPAAAPLGLLLMAGAGFYGWVRRRKRRRA